MEPSTSIPGGPDSSIVEVLDAPESVRNSQGKQTSKKSRNNELKVSRHDKKFRSMTYEPIKSQYK